jgi:O-antigen ligase
MDREKLDGWCERGIIALVLAILVFGPLATGAVRTLEFLVIQGLTIGVMVLWVARLWLRPRPQFIMPPLGWAVLAFAVYAVVRYFGAEIEHVARLELIRVLVYAFLFFAIINNLHRQESVNLVGYTMLFVGMGIAFYAGYQFFSGNSHVWHFENDAYKGRGTGTYINANHLAGFLELLLPLGIAYTIVGRMKPVVRILIGYAALVIAAGIGVTLSRGGWIATGLALTGFFVILLFHRGFRLPAALALLVIIIGVGIYAPRSTAIQSRLSGVVKEAGEQENARYRLWLPSLQLWRENVWTGIGPGHFDYRFRSVRPQEIQLRPDRAHNDFINTLVDWGVVGLGIVFAALGLAAAGVAKSWRGVGGVAADIGSRRSNKFAFVLGGSFGLLALFFHSATDFNMHIPANAILAVTLLALLASHQRFATDRWWTNARLPLVVLVTLVLLAGVAFLGLEGVRRAKEYVWLERAEAAPQFSPARVTALERAFAAEPKNFETAYRIGECFRVQSWEGGGNYAELAQQAMAWFDRAIKLNAYDGYSQLRYGMCLDWLGRRDEAWPYFNRAEELDPNGYYTVAHVGWHFVQLGNYAAARPWFERSRRLQWKNNPIAENYLDICNRRLLEAATNGAPAGLSLSPR